MRVHGRPARVGLARVRGLMGYVNRSRRWVRVSRAEKRDVKRRRRRAEKRETKGEHLRSAFRTMKRGWWY